MDEEGDFFSQRLESNGRIWFVETRTMLPEDLAILQS